MRSARNARTRDVGTPAALPESRVAERLSLSALHKAEDVGAPYERRTPQALI